MFDALFERLARSPFRSRFVLSAAERAQAERAGLSKLRTDAAAVVAKRLAAAYPHNDGRQTPMRGYAVFVAQHACACCCRDCLRKWHGIPQGRPLTAEEQAYVVDVLMQWLEHQMSMPAHTPRRCQKSPQQGEFPFMEDCREKR